MKIVFVSASKVPSDTANSIQMMKVCQAFACLGHEVVLLVPGGVPSEVEKAGLAAHYGLTASFEIRWLAAWNRRLFTWQAVRLARRLGADLLYCWPIQSAAFGMWMKLPVILEMHDLPSGRFGPMWYRRFLDAGGKKRVVVITQALKAALENRFGAGLSSEQVVIAPNGVDLDRFADLPDPETARRQLSLPAGLTVLCAGHLYAGRGADLFLALAAKFPDANFLWAGGRPQDVDEWRSRAAAQGLRNVTFAGFVPNERLPLHLAAADVLLMPYGREIAISSGAGHSADISSPMKMFEYMAAGRLILTSDLPVIREVLDERTAVFCPPEDAGAWEAALRALLPEAGRRQGLGQAARVEVEKYTWSRRAERTLEGFVR